MPFMTQPQKSIPSPLLYYFGHMIQCERERYKGIIPEGKALVAILETSNHTLYPKTFSQALWEGTPGIQGLAQSLWRQSSLRQAVLTVACKAYTPPPCSGLRVLRCPSAVVACQKDSGFIFSGFGHDGGWNDKRLCTPLSLPVAWASGLWISRSGLTGLFLQASWFQRRGGSFGILKSGHFKMRVDIILVKVHFHSIQFHAFYTEKSHKVVEL